MLNTQVPAFPVNSVFKNVFLNIALYDSTPIVPRPNLEDHDMNTFEATVSDDASTQVSALGGDGPSLNLATTK